MKINMQYENGKVSVDCNPSLIEKQYFGRLKDVANTAYKTIEGIVDKAKDAQIGLELKINVSPKQKKDEKKSFTSFIDDLFSRVKKYCQE